MSRKSVFKKIAPKETYSFLLICSLKSFDNVFHKKAVEILNVYNVLIYIIFDINKMTHCL